MCGFIDLNALAPSRTGLSFDYDPEGAISLNGLLTGPSDAAAGSAFAFQRRREEDVLTFQFTRHWECRLADSPPVWMAGIQASASNDLAPSVSEY